MASWLTPVALTSGRSRASFKPAGRIGDWALFGLCAGAALLTVVTLGALIYQLITNAQPAISRLGLGFLVHQTWAPNKSQFGAAALIYGTVVSSLFAVALAGPLGVAIALYLSMVAPPAVRAVIGPVIEMLAAVPSVIMGFWGVVVLAPFLQAHVEPALHSALGFIPLFGAPQPTGLSMFTAGVILTLMILPIVASLSRDLFLTVPRELREGAEALGATRWEVIRGVVLPSTASGVAATTVLALGRALGEAIAVYQVIGNLIQAKASLFVPASTLASRITLDFQSPDNKLHISAIFYL
ncbi:MAG: phosphate ABC transporter permease subunit PstC, partial [Solirubrobacterales bacterium]|nr:phosphate ABC transporter permease subunit PstC [Solirubrobacterales bacterium]